MFFFFFFVNTLPYPGLNGPGKEALWKKEKMLVTNIFSCSHIVFYSSETNTSIWPTYNSSSANTFNLDRAKILLYGKELKINGIILAMFSFSSTINAFSVDDYKILS